MTAPRVSTRDILDGKGPERVQHFPGDVTASAAPGTVLGHDDFGRPFEVVEAELVPAVGHEDGDGCVQVHSLGDGSQDWSCAPGHYRTAVYLKYATVDTLRAATAVVQALRSGGAR